MLAVLTGLFVLLSISSDYAAIYALVVLLIAAACIWLAARRNGNFAMWRAVWDEAWRREMFFQAWAAANPRDLDVKRRSRRIGLGLAVCGLGLAIVLGTALWLGGLMDYILTLATPLVVAALGIWMLVTGRQPPRRRQ